MMHESSEKTENSFLVTKRKKLDWKEVISLKHTAEEIWDIDSVNAKRDWGKLLHLVLSEIHYLEQKEKVKSTTERIRNNLTLRIIAKKFKTSIQLKRQFYVIIVKIFLTLR